MNINIINKKGEKVDSLKLNEKVFDGKINKPLLQQAVKAYLANQRIGSAKVKDRQEVRGGGKKPWRQKGTGRARAGSIRSPLWRGGGVTFGPKPKDWHYELPKKIKRLALKSSLNAKLKENNFIVIDDLKMDSHKTKELAAVLKKLKLTNEKVTMVSLLPDNNLKLAAGNINKVNLMRASDINAYQVLVNTKLLMEKEALKKIEKHLTEVA